MTLEISQMLVVSTAHVSQETAKRIDSAYGKNFEDLMDDAHWLPSFIREEGWMFYAGNLDERELEGAPDDLLKVLRFAADHGCTWVMFDADGPDVEELPSYEW